jgi:hypothetical protein
MEILQCLTCHIKGYTAEYEPYGIHFNASMKSVFLFLTNSLYLSLISYRMKHSVF